MKASARLILKCTLKSTAVSATRRFSTLTLDLRKGDEIAQRLSLQGNPSENTDIFIEPKSNEVYEFIRFAKHFDKDGNPSETLHKAIQERLEN